MTSMKYGLCTFPTEYSMSFPALAAAAEERGFESIWVAEHSHIPASRKTPFPGGGELPRVYYDAMDPFVVLAAAATATRTIKLATGVCLVVQRDPIQTAKEVASLDRISGGRFLFGIGAGWNEEEMANHGTAAYGRRGKLLRERMEAMQAIWTEEKAEYHGEFVDFDPIFAWPKPVQKPRPPIHVGGGWPIAARRAVRLGDGWLPVGDAAGTLRRLPDFRTLAKDAGRDPASLEVSLYFAPPEREALERLRDAGLSRAIFGVPSESADRVLPRLDEYRKLMQQVG